MKLDYDGKAAEMDRIVEQQGSERIEDLNTRQRVHNVSIDVDIS
jgi:hypothetical protein